jgi:hypothetical protein
MVKCDSAHKILCPKWIDNMIVSLALTLQISGKVNINQRRSFHVLNLKVKKALKAYQDGIDGVDRSGKYRQRGAGFAWSKRILFNT